MSTPFRWDELPDIDSHTFTVATVPARFAALGGLQAAIDDRAVSIEPLLEWPERDEHDRGLGGTLPTQPSEGAWRAAGGPAQPGQAARTRRAAGSCVVVRRSRTRGAII